MYVTYLHWHNVSPPVNEWFNHAPGKQHVHTAAAAVHVPTTLAADHVPTAVAAGHVPITVAAADLQVHLWVPVAVVQDDNVSSGKVDAQTTSTRRQQEHKPAGATRSMTHQLTLRTMTMLHGNQSHSHSCRP
jgi:hypothetical protein